MGSIETSGRASPGEAATPGVENVWDYPRPPRVEAVHRRLAVEVWGRVIAETTEGMRVLETSHPPTYYIPMADVAMALLSPADRRSVCEYKGAAQHWDLRIGRQRVRAIAWSYPDPWPGFERLKDHLAFYPALCSRCLVGEEAVVPQSGGFYGGWITRNLQGPFKGAPGTMGW